MPKSSWHSATTAYEFVSNDEKSINEWISLKHTGENNGAGTVRWNAQQTERFKIQTSDITRQFFLDELRDSEAIPNNIKGKLHLIKKTNFERIINDPDIREYLGISYIDGIYSLYNGIATSQLILVLNDLISGMSVGKIYAKKDRQEYIETVKQRLDTISTMESESDVTSNNNNSFEGNYTQDTSDLDNKTTSEDISSPKDGKTNSTQGYPLNRKSLIPHNVNLPISNARILKIFKELKKLEIEYYPNAIAVLFRVFVELSVDEYIKSHNLQAKNVTKLSQKINIIKKYFIEKNIMSENELHPIEMMVTIPTISTSVKTFHQFVHNSMVTPSVDDLKNSWDDLYPFIEKLWK